MRDLTCRQDDTTRELAATSLTPCRTVALRRSRSTLVISLINHFARRRSTWLYCSLNRMLMHTERLHKTSLTVQDKVL